MKSKICPNCGSSEGAEKPFVGAFCIDCMENRLESKNVYVAPQSVKIARCQSCGRIFSGKEMHEDLPEFWHKMFTSKIRSNHAIADLTVEMKRNEADVSCTIMVDGRRVHKEIHFRIESRSFMCDSCKKLSSGYHEVIIQVRGPVPRAAKLATAIERDIELQGGLITRSEEKGQGVDLFIADRDAAIKAVMRVHRPYTASRKLKGVKRDGTNHFITTVCFRL